MHTEVLIQVQCDLAVRACPKLMAALFQFKALPLEVVEFAVHNNTNPFVLVRYGLIAGYQVDDTQPGVAEAYLPVFRKPDALVIGSAMN